MPAPLKKEKQGVRMDFLSKNQFNEDMDRLLEYYGARITEPSLEKTRKILGRFGSINDELVKMRDENR